MASPLHIKYRPNSFDGIIGQKPIVASLRRVLKSKDVPHTYLLTGLSGAGKTTIARIIATEVGCSSRGLIEVDAATLGASGTDNKGAADAVRSLTASMRYGALGESPTRMAIVDECHALSRQGWHALLKSIEEPPAHAYWVLCTTEATKVPHTIKTRCHAYEVKPVPSGDLFDYLLEVAEAEKLAVDDDVIQLCAKEATGSVRQALVNLSAVRGAKDTREARAILSSVSEDDSSKPVKLARMLVAGFKWRDAVQLVASMEDETAEGVRLVVTAYVSKALLNVTEDRRAQRLLAILEQFSTPFFGAEGMAPLLLAVGRLAYN